MSDALWLPNNPLDGIVRAMRIRRIKIVGWRNFQGVELNIAGDVGLVCLVGANGTGKSHVLELLSATAHHFGLSPGIELARGDPFTDPHTLIEVEVEVPRSLIASLDASFGDQAQYAAWDRTLLLTSTRNCGQHTILTLAGGVADPHPQKFAQEIINRIRNSTEVHHLRLDADRAYPKQTVPVHELGGAYETDWAESTFTKERAFRPTSMLYAEWLKYLLSLENQAGARLMQETRRARDQGLPDPNFVDHFNDYKGALKEVLPHIVFTGIDTGKKIAIFDTTGMELTFDQLSGGEREIAFILGQIDRFHLRRGLFLLDEPELHLNCDLIRTWIRYLSGTVTTGQVWIATHSLEAVEAAGAEHSFLLERDQTSKKVISAFSLSDRPVISALARTVGSPAFSISQLTFVFVEGEPGLGERDRYRRIIGNEQEIRITECGGCAEVERRSKALTDLATESAQPLKLRAVVDRDWRSSPEIARLEAKGIFVLPVHEIENLFLHPETLAHILSQNGMAGSSTDLIRTVCDQRAGIWLYEYTVAQPQKEPHPADLGASIKAAIYGRDWNAFASMPAAIDAILGAATDTEQEAKDKFRAVFIAAVAAYTRLRTSDNLWKRCEGKEVFNTLHRQLGFSSASVAEKAIAKVWADNPNLFPTEAAALRSFIVA